MPPRSNGVGTGRSKHPKDDDLEVVNTIISCLDIISRQRIEKCVKSTRCSHISCFDLSNFCEINGISPYYYEKDQVPFIERPSRFEAIPIVQEVKDIENNNQNKDQYIIKLSKDKSSTALFQIRFNGKNLTLSSRKLTGKRKQVGKEVKCPICNVKFLQNEIVSDDFMITLLKHVPKEVESIEIDEDWVVKLVKEKTPFENEQVVEVLDIESEPETGPTTSLKRPNNDIEDRLVSSDDDLPIGRKNKRIKNVIKIVDINEDNDDDDDFDDDSLDDLFNERIDSESNKGSKDDPFVID